MGYNDYDGFDDDDLQDGSPSDLRKAQKAAAKRARELEQEVAKLTSQLAVRNLRDVLEDKGLRPGLARVIAKEDVDVTDSKAIEAWLNDPANQEDFGFSLAGKGNGGASTGETANESESEEGSATDFIRSEFERMQNVGQNALPTGKFAEAVAAMEAADGANPEAVQAALDKAIKTVK